MGKPVNESKTLEIINLLKEYSAENSSNEVESIIEFLEDFEDKQSMDNIERYKKVYNAGRLNKWGLTWKWLYRRYCRYGSRSGHGGRHSIILCSSGECRNWSFFLSSH